MFHLSFLSKCDKQTVKKDVWMCELIGIEISVPGLVLMNCLFNVPQEGEMIGGSAAKEQDGIQAVRSFS